jgi:hypothetical protein
MHHTAASNLRSGVNVKSFTLLLSHTFSRVSGNYQFQHIGAVHVLSKGASTFDKIIYRKARKVGGGRGVLYQN